MNTHASPITVDILILYLLNIAKLHCINLEQIEIY